VWFDPEETVVRKRLPPSFPKRHTDIYVTNKTHPKVQLDRVHQLIRSGENEVFLHALGAAIPRALNLALKVKKEYGEEVSLETATNTVELTDDFESTNTSNSEESNGQRTRFNSGVYVKILHTVPSPVQTETAGAGSPSTDTSEQ